MLILVGVTVTVSLNGGLFEKTREAAKGTEIEKEKEELTVATAVAYDETIDEISKEKLQNELKKWTIEEDDIYKYKCTSPNDNIFLIDKDGEIIRGDSLEISYKIFNTDHGEHMIMFLESDSICKKILKDNNCNSYEEYVYKTMNIDEEDKKDIENEGGIINLLNISMKELLSIQNEEMPFSTLEEIAKNIMIPDVMVKYNLKISNNSAFPKACDDTLGTYFTYTFELEGGENVFKVTLDGQEWTTSIREDYKEKIADGIEVGSKIYPNSNNLYEEFTVLYNDEKHGLQIIRTSGCGYNCEKNAEYESFISKMNQACTEWAENFFKGNKVAIEKVRCVGAPFTYNGDYSEIFEQFTANLENNTYYLEDCLKLQELDILNDKVSSSWYALGSKIVIKTDDDETIYGIRAVSSTGEFGDNIYVDGSKKLLWRS